MSGATALAFADHLLESGDPFNALTWYRLTLFLEPEVPRQEAIRFKMAAAYEAGARWTAAEVAYGMVGEDLAARAAYRAAMVNLQAGRHLAADMAFESVGLYHPDSPWSDRAAFARGIVFLEAQDPRRAALRFQAVSPDAAPWSQRAASLAELAESPLSSRSPALAGAMSTVLPGLGQAYSGHLGDGIMALIANGVLGTWSYTLLRQGVEDDQAWRVGLGSTIGAMFLLTWTSNIYGAWRSAGRYNQRQARELAEQVLEQAYDPTLELTVEDVKLP